MKISLIVRLFITSTMVSSFVWAGIICQNFYGGKSSPFLKLVSFENRTNKEAANQDTYNRKLDDADIENKIDYIGSLNQKIFSGSQGTLSQNAIWIIHANYTVLKDDLIFLRERPENVSMANFEKFSTALKALDILIEETGFFAKYEEKGYSLVPTAKQTIKKMLPDSVTKDINDLREIFSTIVENEFINMNRYESFTMRPFRGVMTHSAHNTLSGLLNDHIGTAISILEKIKSNYSGLKFDLSEVEPLVTELNRLIKSDRFKTYQNNNLKSWFPSNRASAEALKQTLVRYEALAKQFADGVQFGRALSLAPQSTEKITEKDFSDTQKQLFEILMQTKYNGGINRQTIAEIIFSLTSRIKNSEQLNSFPEFGQKLNEIFIAMETVIKQVKPKDPLAVSLRIELDRLKALLN